MGKKNIVWNDYISQNERFADLFNGVVFRGRRIIRPEHLTDLDTKLWRRRQEKNSLLNGANLNLFLKLLFYECVR